MRRRPVWSGDEHAVPFRSRRIAARMRGAAPGSPRLYRRRTRRRALDPEQRFRLAPRRRFQPPPRRARLDRHDLAEALRRRRAQLSRTLYGHRGTARGRRAGRVPLDRRPAERAAAAALWQRRAARDFSARHLPRRNLFRDRHERAGFGLRPGLDPHPRDPGLRRLRGDRREGVDELRARVALRDHAGAHRYARPEEPPCRAVAADRRSEGAGGHDPADPQPRRRARFQRDRPRPRLRAERASGRSARATAGVR